MAKQASPKDFYMSMKKQEATAKWDFLASYAEKPLNTYLSGFGFNHKAGDSEVHLEIPVGTGKKILFAYVFQLVLSNQGLSFATNADPPHAIWRMGIKGNVLIKGAGYEERLEIPSQSQAIDVKVLIDEIRGYASDRKPTRKSLIRFNEQVDDRNIISLQLGNKNSTWTWSGDLLGCDENSQLKQSINFLLRYFSSLKNLPFIECLVGADLSYDMVLSSGYYELKSFVFTSQPGVVNIFTQSAKSGRDQGYQKPHFGLEHDHKYTPIPEGYNASVIFSREFFQDSYLIGIIHDLTYGRWDGEFRKPEAVNVETGIKLQLRKLHRAEYPYIRGGLYQRSPTDWYLFPDHIFDLDEQPIELEIAGDDDHFEPKWKWKWDYQDSWRSIRHQLSLLPAEIRKTPEYWKFTSKVDESRQQLAWFHGRFIQLSFGILDIHRPKHDLGLGNINNSAVMPHFIHFDDINLDRVTNVFMWDKHMMNPCEVWQPYDFVVVGNLNVPGYMT